MGIRYPSDRGDTSSRRPILIPLSWNTDTKPAVFSIGYEGLTIDSFLNKLIANNITLVVDVRNNPQSMKYGFSKKSFKKYIENAGM